VVVVVLPRWSSGSGGKPSADPIGAVDDEEDKSLFDSLLPPLLLLLLLVLEW